jgi:hypothetical protein
MFRARYRSLIAILCTLCLLGAQQAAYAHYIGHVGCAIGTPAAPDGNGDASQHACETCAAFAGLTAAPPACVAPLAAMHVTAAPLPDLASAYAPAPPAPPYTARAPPAIL